jgi:tetratricopeptide (TPR) repeat protein
MTAEMEVMPIERALDLASKVSVTSLDEYDRVLDCLEYHECWNPYFDLVKAQFKSRSAHSIKDYVRLIRVKISYLEDVKSAAQNCRELIQAEKMTFTDFRTYVLEKIIDVEDYKIEGDLLTGAWEVFPHREDQISAVERLCFIFEKKAHNETLLHQFYERLRKMQPENAKALRYFRNLFSQAQDWPAVIDVLKRLLSAAKHKQEVFRYAQELAAVYLYQIGDCQAAIRYIEDYCTGSTLDTSTIHFEAYYRLGDLEGCLRVLRSALLAVDDVETRAIVHFRIGSIFEQLNQTQMAFDNYQKTIDLNENFYEAIEGIVSCAIKLKNWTAVRDGLVKLCEKTRSPDLVVQLKAGIQRLDEGLAHANANS